MKTRLQFQGELGQQARVYRGVLQSLVQIARMEGLRGLYRPGPPLGLPGPRMIFHCWAAADAQRWNLLENAFFSTDS